jgi:hypothetical protein
MGLGPWVTRRPRRPTGQHATVGQDADRQRGSADHGTRGEGRASYLVRQWSLAAGMDDWGMYMRGASAIAAIAVSVVMLESTVGWGRSAALDAVTSPAVAANLPPAVADVVDVVCSSAGTSVSAPGSPPNATAYTSASRTRPEHPVSTSTTASRWAQAEANRWTRGPS